MKYIKLEEVKDFEALLEEIIDVLKADGVVLMPSDTSYGFLVKADSEKAIQKLNDFKKREENKLYSVCVADRVMLEDYLDLDEVGREVMEMYLPGPLTLVADSKMKKGETLGVRIPDHNLMLSVAKELGSAFCTTSANVSGEESPYALEQVHEQMKEDMLKIDLIIDAGVLDYNAPSTVVKVEDNQVEILRDGELSERLRAEYLVKMLEG